MAKASSSMPAIVKGGSQKLGKGRENGNRFLLKPIREERKSAINKEKNSLGKFRPKWEKHRKSCKIPDAFPEIETGFLRLYSDTVKRQMKSERTSQTGGKRNEFSTCTH